ncbi:MAG: ABC transporter ATP-binding protein [Deltaproteobacteria bacterium]|nr:ABC transporter ATP-binding protein [Deltaproteobacteria bacterium]
MLRLKDVTLALGSFNISLHVEQGTYLVLLGPTGTGKTVLLETIAGMHRVDSGNIFIDTKEVTNLPPEKRRLGVVYQDYALFPHMTVHENIAFGLRLRKQPKDLIRQSIREAKGGTGQSSGVTTLCTALRRALKRAGPL